MINYELQLSGSYPLLDILNGDPITFNRNLNNYYRLVMEKKLICLRGHTRTPENISNSGDCKKCRNIRLTNYFKTTKGKITRKRANRNYLFKFGYKHIARQFIRRAVLSRRLVKLNKCVLCRNEGKTEFHHLNYDLDDTFKNILEICKPCHKGI